MVKGNESKSGLYMRFGLCEWKVMLFGLCNAPATFQAMIDDWFHDIMDKGVIIYLDDILIYIENIAES